jgi:hypothetical protein
MAVRSGRALPGEELIFWWTDSPMQPTTMPMLLALGPPAGVVRRGAARSVFLDRAQLVLAQGACFGHRTRCGRQCAQGTCLRGLTGPKSAGRGSFAQKASAPAVVRMSNVSY